MADPLDLAALERLEALERRATPGRWSWNSYSGIAAKVPEGHPLEDYEEDDPGDRGLAWICWIDGGPTQKGHGDALRVAEARANAELIEGLRNASPALLRLARAAQEVLPMLEDYEDTHAKEWPCLGEALRLLRAAAGATEGKENHRG